MGLLQFYVNLTLHRNQQLGVLPISVLKGTRMNQKQCRGYFWDHSQLRTQSNAAVTNYNEFTYLKASSIRPLSEMEEHVEGMTAIVPNYWFFSIVRQDRENGSNNRPYWVKVTSYSPPRAQRGSRCIALLILNLGARRGWVVSTTPRPLYPRERPGTHCTGGWVDPRAGLDVCEKSRTHCDSIRRPSSS
jgi:hypothetical protein